MKIATVVGARPQFIKAVPVSAVLRKGHIEYLIHTGQHYDANMSQVFFDELGIPRPDINLGLGSATHAVQTGKMLVGIEEILIKEKPDLLLVYGDTNSTLAGALAASKLNIPVAHIEAGLRSFNRKMPEEVNRVLTDKIAETLFCPTDTAVANLKNEGVTTGVHQVGDVMYDAALQFGKIAEVKSTVLDELNLQPKEFMLATVHRPSSTDSRESLTPIVAAFIESGVKIVFPVHPRTRGFLEKYDLPARLNAVDSLLIIEPASYLDMLVLEKNAAKILTDSGGVQKEAYFYQVPCVTLREDTEWVETVDDGWNILVGTDKEKILNGILYFEPTSPQRSLFGDGHASEKIVDLI